MGSGHKKQIKKCQGRLLAKYPYVNAGNCSSALTREYKEYPDLSPQNLPLKPPPAQHSAAASQGETPAEAAIQPSRPRSAQPPRGLREPRPSRCCSAPAPRPQRPVPPGLGRAPAGAAAAGRRGQHVRRPLTALSAGARPAAAPPGPAAAPHGPSAPTPAPSDPPSAAPGREARRPRGGRRRTRLPPPSGAAVAPRAPQGGPSTPGSAASPAPPPAQLPPPPPAAATAPVPAPAAPLQRRRPGSQEAERGGHNVCARRGGDCTSGSGTGGAPELPAPPPLSLSAPRFVRPAAAAARGREERPWPGSG